MIPRTKKMRQARALSAQLGLDDFERRELAMMLPSQANASEPVSWAKLDEGELQMLCWQMEGALRVYELLRQRVQHRDYEG